MPERFEPKTIPRRTATPAPKKTGKARAKPVHREEAMQRAMYDIIYKVQKTTGAFMCYAVPNGGARSSVEALLLKKAGVRAGAADWEVHGPGRNTIFIELKYWTPPKTKPGQAAPIESLLSDDQKLFRTEVVRFGFPYEVIAVDNPVDGIRLFFAILARYGISVPAMWNWHEIRELTKDDQ